MYGRRTPEVEDRFLDSVEALKSVETNHGSALFINHFLSPVDSKDALYPTSFYSKDDFGDLLFNSSSMLTEEMCMFAKTKGYHDIKPGKSRGFIQNGDSKDIIDFLQIGTLGTVPTNAKKDVPKK